MAKCHEQECYDCETTNEISEKSCRIEDIFICKECGLANSIVRCERMKRHLEAMEETVNPFPSRYDESLHWAGLEDNQW